MSAANMAALPLTGARHNLDLLTGAAVSPWQPHSFHPGDVENGSLFLVLYIRPEWFLEMSNLSDVSAYGSK